MSASNFVNERHTFTTPFLPASLTLEYAILPQMWVSLGLGYRVVFAGKQEYSPDGQAFARIGLRFDISRAGVVLPALEDLLRNRIEMEDMRDNNISKQ